MTKKATKLLKKLHKELNKKEACNTYFLIEDANTGALKPVQCYTANKMQNEDKIKQLLVPMIRKVARKELKTLNQQAERLLTSVVSNAVNYEKSQRTDFDSSN
ncbi:hypothetical protein EDM00_10445 [Ornithobacterium rhinotracheale]|uniref:hypothetical protein n=1 Tax=Ornithobacterium rhinotracheale TaxID=28251 RepID=UPI00129C2EEE|nr:hypothetical protein [Ornithobacterium rhinotracheale]MRI64399.1 hypothetical protein [Ornithobacterium rhinotracheale]